MIEPIPEDNKLTGEDIEGCMEANCIQFVGRFVF